MFRFLEVGEVKDNTIAGMLNKIVWVDKANLRRYSVIVIDRLRPGGLREVQLSESVKVLKDRLIIGETTIPIHRIVEIRRDGEPVWVRKSASARK